MFDEITARSHHARFLSLFKTVGFGEEEALNKCRESIQVVINLSRIFDLNHQQIAHDILRSLVVGQTWEMRKYGILINEREIKARVRERNAPDYLKAREEVNARLTLLCERYGTKVNKRRAKVYETLYKIYEFFYGCRYYIISGKEEG
jgi:hypothetical protein